jgi:hypothetical protein
MHDQKMEYGVKIGNISMRMTSTNLKIQAPYFYKDFLATVTKPDIDIHLHSGIPDIEPEEKIFDSGSHWKLYRWRGKHFFSFTSPVPIPHIYKVAIFSQDFSHGDLYVNYVSYHETIDPIEYPLDELLTVNYLAQGHGMEVHGLGIINDSIGLAFVGVSGAGKSTLAELWKKRDVKILSDDRLIFRRKEGTIQMYGTPWHGDARISLNEEIPLHGLFFLKQAKDNRIVSLKPAEVATRLMVRCFPTFYYIQGMEYTLKFVSEIAQQIPCFELQFTPDQRAVDEVMNYVKRNSP